MVLIRLITLVSLEHNVRIFAKHVKSKQNDLADSLSRLKFRDFYTLVRKKDIQLERPEKIPDKIWPMQKIWLY